MKTLPSGIDSANTQARSPSVAALILKRKDRVDGSGCSRGLFFFVGVCLLLVLPPVGAILIASAILADAKFATKHYCGGCGNDVVVTARVCPTCRVPLTMPPAKGNGVFVFVVLLAVAVLCAVAMLLKSRFKSWESAAADRNRQALIEETVPQIDDEPVILVAEREWIAADGKKMRAALLDVVREADGKLIGKFLRADGREFDVPIGNLSPEGIAGVKKAMIDAGLWNEGE